MAKKSSPPVLLSGGNPQIAKADGDAPVEAYLSAMPGWKQDLGRQVDNLVVATLPEVRKAVRWNTPFYGSQELGWFLGFHCLTKYIKVSFLNGNLLKPMPPIESKDEKTRYSHIFENVQLDEEQWISWIQQAAALPAWKGFSWESD